MNIHLPFWMLIKPAKICRVGWGPSPQNYLASLSELTKIFQQQNMADFFGHGANSSSLNHYVTLCYTSEISSYIFLNFVILVSNGPHVRIG